jgi:hypothetical protein
MNPASANPVQLMESAGASSGLLATNLRLWLFSLAVVLVLFVQRQALRLMSLARQLNL